MVELEDEADVPRAPAGQLRLPTSREISWSPTQTSPCAGPVQPGDQVQQRGLARAAGAHQAEELALGHVQRQVVEHVEPLAAAAEELVDAVDANNRRRLAGMHGHVESRQCVATRLRTWDGEARRVGSRLVSASCKNDTIAPISGFR